MSHYLKIKLFVLFITTCTFTGCRQQDTNVSAATVSRIAIDSSYAEDDSVTTFLSPYREHVNNTLDSALSYAPTLLTKNDGERNSSLGNLMADLLLKMSDSLMRLQGQPPVDIALLNHGGIRSIISAGPVSARTAYELMPFENTIVLLEMDGEALTEMARYLSAEDRPTPIAGMSLVVDENNRILSVEIGGRPLNQEETYRLVTSNFLVTGGDGMAFLGKARTTTDLGYKIRNAIIDYFKITDTLRTGVDDRFIQRQKP